MMGQERVHLIPLSGPGIHGIPTSPRSGIRNRQYSMLAWHPYADLNITLSLLSDTPRLSGPEVSGSSSVPCPFSSMAEFTETFHQDNDVKTAQVNTTLRIRTCMPTSKLACSLVAILGSTRKPCGLRQLPAAVSATRPKVPP